MHIIALIYRATERAHVKTNTMHELDRVNIFGQRDITYYKDLILEKVYDKCLRTKRETWYTIPTNQLVKILFHVSLPNQQL